MEFGRSNGDARMEAIGKHINTTLTAQCYRKTLRWLVASSIVLHIKMVKVDAMAANGCRQRNDGMEVECTFHSPMIHTKSVILFNAISSHFSSIGCRWHCMTPAIFLAAFSVPDKSVRFSRMAQCNKYSISFHAIYQRFEVI